MNYQEALEKLEKLLAGYRLKYISVTKKEKEQLTQSAPGSFEELCMLYGELEEIINRFAGIEKVVVNPRDIHPATYSNYIAATLFSGWGHYKHEGYTQLLKVVGKVRQHTKDPTIPQVEYSVTNLVRILRRFRECCQYLTLPLQNEGGVQGILWIMLRSHFERLDRHETLPKFGVKGYIPDFGIPDLRVLIEAKFIGQKTKVADIQEEILADIPGYLNESTSYDSVVVFVYDAAHKLRDDRKFIEDLRSVDGIINVIVIPGIGLGDSND